MSVSACAPKVALAPVPTVQAPKFPDYVFPTIPAEYVNAPAGRGVQRGWSFLQAGDFKTAERELTAALQLVPDLGAAETALGYVAMARQDPRGALARFDRALGRQHAYAPALVGRGQALVALGRLADAVTALTAAVAANPALTDVARQIDVLRFRAEQQALTAARQAAREKRFDEAIAAFQSAITASPDSAFLYRELGDAEAQKGDVDAALEHWRRAVEGDSTDVRALEQIGDVLASRGDLEGALKAFSDATAVDSTLDLEKKVADLRKRIATERLPEQYRAISETEAITRADLAALIGVRLPHLVEAGARRPAVPMTDVRGNWAATWILAVARAGIMEPYANHTFQPRALVRRVDFAPVASRLLARVGGNRRAPSAGESPRTRFADLAPTHVANRAALETVAAGLLSVGADNRFEPSKPVSGVEAIDAINQIDMLSLAAASSGPSGR